MTRNSDNKRMVKEITSRQIQRKQVSFTWEQRYQQLVTDCDALLAYNTDLRLDLKQTKLAYAALLAKTPNRHRNQ